mmetsp:Transcript_133232/g.371408  ORF Transcript_133232/g.371408 Transcript_133232/m.371408 type:complete len:223 (-) Transcript_133232:147-815(-)
MAYIDAYNEGYCSCLAIGSAGEGVGGYSKYKDLGRRHGGASGARKDANEDYGLLATKQDIEDFKTWSVGKRFKWFGSMEVSGMIGKHSQCVSAIQEWLAHCKQQKLKPLIYYSGHGDENGNWVFPDGVVTFDDIEQYNNTINTGFVVDVISDCCYSGAWVDLSQQRTKMNVVAASAADDCAIDRIFAQAFFKNSAAHREILHDIKACYTRFDGRNACVKYNF